MHAAQMSAARGTSPIWLQLHWWELHPAPRIVEHLPPDDAFIHSLNNLPTINSPGFRSGRRQCLTRERLPSRFDEQGGTGASEIEAAFDSVDCGRDVGLKALTPRFITASMDINGVGGAVELCIKFDVEQVEADWCRANMKIGPDQTFCRHTTIINAPSGVFQATYFFPGKS